MVISGLSRLLNHGHDVRFDLYRNFIDSRRAEDTHHGGGQDSGNLVRTWSAVNRDPAGQRGGYRSIRFECSFSLMRIADFVHAALGRKVQALLLHFLFQIDDRKDAKLMAGGRVSDRRVNFGDALP